VLYEVTRIGTPRRKKKKRTDGTEWKRELQVKLTQRRRRVVPTLSIVLVNVQLGRLEKIRQEMRNAARDVTDAQIVSLHESLSLSSAREFRGTMEARQQTEVNDDM